MGLRDKPKNGLFCGTDSQLRDDGALEYIYKLTGFFINPTTYSSITNDPQRQNLKRGQFHFGIGMNIESNHQRIDFSGISYIYRLTISGKCLFGVEG